MGTTLATKWIISEGSETPRRWRAAESKKRAWTAGRPKKARAHDGSSPWQKQHSTSPEATAIPPAASTS
eukprot:3395300-Pyramimonas_sp.AAC.1